MGKRAEVPFVRRPIEEIVATAHAAGLKAFTTNESVESAWIDVRSKWLEKMLPDGQGMSDDDFDNVMTHAAKAFDTGIEEYLDRSATQHAVETNIDRERADHQFALTCASEVFDWLRGIFDAIDVAADNTTNLTVMRQQIKRLASCGSYLAADRCDLLASNSEALDG